MKRKVKISRLIERQVNLVADIMNSISEEEFVKYLWENEKNNAYPIFNFCVSVSAQAATVLPESRESILNYIKNRDKPEEVVSE